MRRETLFKIAVLAMTSLVMLVFTEVVIRQFQPEPATWREPQATHLESPLLGWVLPPGLEAYTIEAPVSVNQLGYRDDEMSRSKPPGELRVLALGDSFTFALGVEFDDLWAQQLERALAERRKENVQVINAGVAGYNTRQELILLESEGWDLDPDLVVVAFYWNDLVGNEEPLPDYATTPKIRPDRLTWERGERDQSHMIPAFIRDRLRRSVLLYQLTIRSKQVLALLGGGEPGEYTLVQQALLGGDADFLEPYWEATGHRLEQIANSAAERGVPVILLAFPMENEIKRSYPQMRMVEDLRRIWEPTGMPFVDVTPAFRLALEQGDNPFLPYDLHPNQTGMRIASDAIVHAIESNGLLRTPNEDVAGAAAR